MSLFLGSVASFRCDRVECGATQIREIGSGRPPGWMRLVKREDTPALKGASADLCERCAALLGEVADGHLSKVAGGLN